MPEGHERARPVVSRRASLHPDQARRQGLLKKPWHLAAPQRLAQDDLSIPVHACSWKTFFAISRPIVTISGMGVFLSGSWTCLFWHV